MMIGAGIMAGYHDARFDFNKKTFLYAARMLRASIVSWLIVKH